MTFGTTLVIPYNTIPFLVAKNLSFDQEIPRLFWTQSFITSFTSHTNGPCPKPDESIPQS